MCFHGNQHPLSIKHPFISLYTKYQSHKFICFPIMNSPVFPSLDDIYCISFSFSILSFIFKVLVVCMQLYAPFSLFVDLLVHWSHFIDDFAVLI